MSDVLKPRRKTPPADIAALSPPLSPQSEKMFLRKDPGVVSSSGGEIPSDMNIPDNYVQHALKTQKELPPITLNNILQEISWVSFIVLTLTPTIAFVGAYYTSLGWKTAMFSVLYYYITGLGITAGE